MEAVRTASLDSVITLVDTISSKLQLVSHDYRGSDVLQVELSLFLKLLLCTTCFQSNLQSSLLSDLSEELRHFYLILRVERRLEYVMVEEISRFRETLRIFQRQFCGSNDACLVDVVLDTLQTMDGDKDGLGELKMELKLIRLMNQASPQIFPLCKIMAEVYDKAIQFCYTAHSSLNLELAESCSSFRASLLKCCKHHIPELQSADNICAWHFLQLSAFYDSLSASLWDVYFWGQCHPKVNHFIQHLINTVTFLKSFMRLVGYEIGISNLSEWFLVHCQFSAISAASLGYKCWFYRDDCGQELWHQLNLRGCELAEKVRPGSGNIQVTQNYIQTLTTSATSTSESYVAESSMFDRLSTLDFVGFLHGYLSQLVTGTACFVVSWEQIKGIAMKLKHLREMLQTDSWPKGELIEVTIIIFHLHTLKRKDKITKDLEFRIFQLLRYSTSHSTWITQLLENACPRILARRSLEIPLPHLTLNGVVVSSGIKTAEQIKCQLLSNSKGLDLIAVVSKDGESMMATNLIKMVYHDSDVVNHFKIRSLCHCNCAAQGYKQNRLKQVLDCVSSKNSCDYSEMSKDYLARVDFGSLKGKRYLIVLNGVQRSQFWRDAMSSFPNDGNQSKILFTSDTVSDPGYFSVEPVSCIRRGMVKMGSCCKGM